MEDKQAPPTLVPSNSAAARSQGPPVRDHADKNHARPEKIMGGSVLFSIPAGEQRCLASGLRERPQQAILFWGETDTKSSFGNCLLMLHGFLRLGLRGSLICWLGFPMGGTEMQGRCGAGRGHSHALVLSLGNPRGGSIVAAPIITVRKPFPLHGRPPSQSKI